MQGKPHGATPAPQASRAPLSISRGACVVYGQQLITHRHTCVTAIARTYHVPFIPEGSLVPPSIPPVALTTLTTVAKN